MISKAMVIRSMLQRNLAICVCVFVLPFGRIESLPSTHEIKDVLSQMGFSSQCLDYALEGCQNENFEKSVLNQLDKSVSGLHKLKRRHDQDRSNDLKTINQKLDSLETMIDNMRSSSYQQTDCQPACEGKYRCLIGSCVYIHNEIRSWKQARHFCQNQGKGVDLVVFKDTKSYYDILQFLKNSSITNVWIGAADAAVEGSWKWIDGTDMPMGSPYWGNYNNKLQPDGGKKENCAFMYREMDYYIYDYMCSHPSAQAFCQYFPS